MEKILEVKEISKKYQGEKGEVLAIDNVNFRVKRGEFISIIGPSGCGKSTLLSIISVAAQPFLVLQRLWFHWLTALLVCQFA